MGVSIGVTEDKSCGYVFDWTGLGIRPILKSNVMVMVSFQLGFKPSFISYSVTNTLS